MDITVTMMDGTSHVLRVNPQDTVGSLKALIHAQMGVAPEKQQLVLVRGGSKKPLNQDSQSLSSYGVGPGAQISLLLREPTTIQVFLKGQDGKTRTYDVKPNEIVKDLKLVVQAREGVQVSQQRLLFQSREMNDASRISDYGVKQHSTIELMLHLRGG